TNIGSTASPDPTDLPVPAVDDAGDSNHETDNDEDAPMGFRGKGKCARVKAETMVTFINEPVKALRAGALRKAKYQRLCFKDKPDLDGAYNAYQRAVYLITIENKLHAFKINAWARKIKPDVIQFQYNLTSSFLVGLTSFGNLSTAPLRLKSKAMLSWLWVTPNVLFYSRAKASWPRSSSMLWHPTQTHAKHFSGLSTAKKSSKRSLARLATHGKWRLGWSGTNTGEKLAKLGVTLQIQENDQFEKPEDFCKRPSDMLLGQTQHILAAFAKGWVKLIGPPKPEDSINGPLSIGHKINNDESTNGDNPNMTVYVGQTGSAVSKKVAAKKGSIEKHSKA
ncbi:hypothetical protein MJO28_012510, partial [Puccinia striiformis f. sp. tritici]